MIDTDRRLHMEGIARDLVQTKDSDGLSRWHPEPERAFTTEKMIGWMITSGVTQPVGDAPFGVDHRGRVRTIVVHIAEDFAARAYDFAKSAWNPVLEEVCTIWHRRHGKDAVSFLDTLQDQLAGRIKVRRMALPPRPTGCPSEDVSTARMAAARASEEVADCSRSDALARCVEAEAMDGRSADDLSRETVCRMLKEMGGTRWSGTNKVCLDSRMTYDVGVDLDDVDVVVAPVRVEGVSDRSLGGCAWDLVEISMRRLRIVYRGPESADRARKSHAMDTVLGWLTSEFSERYSKKICMERWVRMW